MHWSEKLDILGSQRKACAFFIDFHGVHGWVMELSTLREHDIQMAFPNFQTHTKTNESPDIQIHASHIQKETYRKAFQQVQFHLHRGDSYLTNLTFATPIETNATLDQIFQQAKAKYKINFKDEWICFSPETFVQIKHNHISTFPMKGTIDANIENAEHVLRNDIKEKAEHHTIVDLLRNDLSMVAKKVHVEKLMYLDKIITQTGEILQMSSEIRGELPKNWRNQLGTILQKLLPAGSISGAPKDKTLEIISHTENYHRGFYTGIAGIYDGDTVESCVLIRFIEKTKNGFVYKSGGGITAMSHLDNEYQELKQKIYVPIS